MTPVVSPATVFFSNYDKNGCVQCAGVLTRCSDARISDLRRPSYAHKVILHCGNPAHRHGMHDLQILYVLCGAGQDWNGRGRKMKIREYKVPLNHEIFQAYSGPSPGR